MWKKQLNRELDLAMYEQQIESIADKIKKLSEKAGLKKPPKLKQFKEPTPPAYYNGPLNRLGVSETLLKHWQRGLYDEKDIDAILAHEIGHAISHQRRSRYYKIPAMHLSVLFLTVIVAALGTILAPSIFQKLILTGFLIAFVIWGLCVPWVIRRTYVPSELEADINAVVFDLVDPHQLVRQMVRAGNVALSTKELSPFQTLKYIWSILTHPSYADRLRNLNCKIREIEIEGSKQQGKSS